MWNLFKRKPRRQSGNDLMWLSEDAKMRGIAAAIGSAVAGRCPVLLIAHFPETLERLLAALQRANITPLRLDGKLSPAAARAKLTAASSPLVTLASGLERTGPATGTEPPAPDPAPLVIAIERYPLREHDEQVARFAECLYARLTVQTHVALDDVLMQSFAGDRTRRILQTLGMQENDNISHTMLDRSIEQAQEKVAKRHPMGMASPTEAAWREAPTAATSR